MTRQQNNQNNHHSCHTRPYVKVYCQFPIELAIIFDVLQLLFFTPGNSSHFCPVGFFFPVNYQQES